MPPLALLALVLVAGYLAAILAWPFLIHRNRNLRWAFLALLTGTLITLLFIIPANQRQLRAAGCLLLMDLWLRMADLVRQGPAITAYWPGCEKNCRFLLPVPLFLATLKDWCAAKSLESRIGSVLPSAIMGGLVFAAAWGALYRLHSSEFLASHFLWDHIVKTVLFVFPVEAAAYLGRGLDRACGFNAPLVMNRIYLARTPAEFWVRYNRRVHAWLLQNIFVPVGGLRRPVKGIVLVFAFSAFFHEIAFSIARSRIDGYQAVFFLMQIPAVLTSPALEKFARAGGLISKSLAHAVTWAWFLASSVFFFHGVDQVIPLLYTSRPWLP